MYALKASEILARSLCICQVCGSPVFYLQDSLAHEFVDEHVRWKLERRTTNWCGFKHGSASCSINNEVASMPNLQDSDCRGTGRVKKSESGHKVVLLPELSAQDFVSYHLQDVQKFGATWNRHLDFNEFLVQFDVGGSCPPCPSMSFSCIFLLKCSLLCLAKAITACEAVKSNSRQCLDIAECGTGRRALHIIYFYLAIHPSIHPSMYPLRLN